MTYKIDPIVTRISSPITLVMPNGDKKRFESGQSASIVVFEQRYVIDKIIAKDNEISIYLKEINAPIGEGSFF